MLSRVLIPVFVLRNVIIDNPFGSCCCTICLNGCVVSAAAHGEENAELLQASGSNESDENLTFVSAFNYQRWFGSLLLRELVASVSSSIEDALKNPTFYDLKVRLHFLNIFPIIRGDAVIQFSQTEFIILNICTRKWLQISSIYFSEYWYTGFLLLVIYWFYMSLLPLMFCDWFC